MNTKYQFPSGHKEDGSRIKSGTTEYRCIMHLDGDAFFVAVEMAKNPILRGRPVVTGQERGIASALSYEAKKLGITRGMPVFQIKKEFPQVVIVSSDYESYAVFSRRMFDIVKRYTDVVEEYSIDECFADFSHIESFVKDPRPVLEKIKEDVRRELGISVSLGLGPSKVIAKTASKRNKPNGLTILYPKDIPKVLAETPVQGVWGIGSAIAIALRKKGVATALEFSCKPLEWVREHFSKPMIEMWYELNCVSVLEVRMESESQKSIMKTRTFGPASGDYARVFSQLSKNIEHACKKSREMGLVAREFTIYLKTKDFSYSKDWCRLHAPTNSPLDLISQARALYDRLFDTRSLYRATGVVLFGLMPEGKIGQDLFGEAELRGERDKVVGVMDKVNRKYGRNVIHIASSSKAILRDKEDDVEMPGMSRGFFKRLAVPYLGDAF